MSRLSQLDPQAMTPQQRAVYDAIVSGPRGRALGPHNAWLRSPGLAQPAQELGAFCRFRSSLEPRLAELAIIATAAQWRAQFEWYAHAPMARDAGIAEAVIEAIRTGQTPQFARDDEALVFEVTRSLYVARRLPDALYRRACETLGEAGLVELIGILGYYALVSMTLNTFEVRPPAGAALPFAEV